MAAVYRPTEKTKFPYFIDIHFHQATFSESKLNSDGLRKEDAWKEAQKDQNKYMYIIQMYCICGTDLTDCLYLIPWQVNVLIRF